MASDVIVLDVDPRLAVHLALAIKLHLRECRRDSVPFPEELDHLLRVAWERAKSATDRHDPPSLDALVDLLQGGRVDTLLVNIGTAAKALGISSRQVERVIGDGTLPSVLLGGRRLVHVRDLEAYAESLRPGAPFRVEAKAAKAAPVARRRQPAAAADGAHNRGAGTRSPRVPAFPVVSREQLQDTRRDRHPGQRSRDLVGGRQCSDSRQRRGSGRSVRVRPGAGERARARRTRLLQGRRARRAPLRQPRRAADRGKVLVGARGAARAHYSITAEDMRDQRDRALVSFRPQ